MRLDPLYLLLNVLILSELLNINRSNVVRIPIMRICAFAHLAACDLYAYHMTMRLDPVSDLTSYAGTSYACTEVHL